MKKLILAAALAGVSFASFAADNYDLEPNHTFPRFAINHLGFSTFHGQFNKTSGTATIDTAKKTGSVDVTIDVSSVSTGVAKLDEHLQSPDFFNTAKYPTITFKSTSFKFDGDKLDKVTGDLTLLGVTKPVTLDVEHFVCKDHPMTKKPACGADLEGKIKRSDWGMTTYVPAVGDEVELSIEVEAIKK
ncbi:MAG: YceI family protein [Solimonas sp.]